MVTGGKEMGMQRAACIEVQDAKRKLHLGAKCKEEVASRCKMQTADWIWVQNANSKLLYALLSSTHLVWVLGKGIFFLCSGLRAGFGFSFGFSFGVGCGWRDPLPWPSADGGFSLQARHSLRGGGGSGGEQFLLHRGHRLQRPHRR